MLQLPFRLTNLRHHRKFLAAETRQGRPVGKAAGQPLRQPDKRLQQQHQVAQHIGGYRGQLPPVHRAKCFRNDLGKNQNEQSQYGRGDTQIITAKHRRRLGARSGGAHGMRHRVEGENRGERRIDILLQPPQQAPGFMPLTLQQADIGTSNTENNGLGDGAEERETQRDQNVNDQ